MHYVRGSMLLAAALSSLVFAGCSGGPGGSAPPLPPSQAPIGAPIAAPGTPDAVPSSTQSTSSSTEYKLEGPIVALKPGGFQISGGKGVGYVNIYPTSSTTLSYNGLKPAVGYYAVVEAANLQGSSPSSIALYKSQPGSGGSSGVPTHVMTADVLYTYGGTPTSVPLSSVAPYLTWVQTSAPYASEIRGAGLKVDVYMNYWRNYASDNPVVGYTDLKPGGAHAPAEAKTCSGSVIYDPTYGGGYEADARSAYALGHALVDAQFHESEFGGQYDALFTDDTGALWGIPTPCGYTDAVYKSATNSVSAHLGKTIFVNTLNAGTSVVSQVGYAAASNIIGAMCEGCYAYWNSVNGKDVDLERTGSTWLDTENGEALMVADHKIFWDYARAIGNPVYETPLRMYAYASFLLTYSPSYAMLQESFQSAHVFPVMPETGLVPEDPLTTSTSASSYERAGGSYMREFGACYYRGADKGKCAVVVNPGTISVPVPTTAYGHSMELVGGGVLDGGYVEFSGARPSSLAPGTAAILFP